MTLADEQHESQKQYIAAQLAFVALSYQNAAEQVANLAENTAQALKRLLSAADDLGFGVEFRVKCRNLNVELPL